ncbi:uncharacterized protein FIBRA_07288 [Fibroporia radiculosa]|uniref:Macro-like domain-containing protein n=1 Tax=Fibroporia radiculosa TaxID=599839 RepID=J4IBQ7_9APHY|nr:uncharacterized protein FIBRA_07288 [Fibroporia radiculosa]CCM05081.1 predicted protein [Fibroporia radiculosa]
MDCSFTLLDISADLVEQWRIAFEKHIPHILGMKVITLQFKLADLSGPASQFDCIVSPANSYGRLDGGHMITHYAFIPIDSFDFFLAEALAPAEELEAPTKLAQAALYRRWRGYAPPGSCTLVSLLNSSCANNRHSCSYIALCPTMRVPINVEWDREIVYNCVWSLLVALDEHNRAVKTNGGVKISRVLMPGLATGIGGISAEQCAQQMALAFKHFEDALAHPQKWSALEWDDAIDYAEDVRATHRRRVGD